MIGHLAPHVVAWWVLAVLAAIALLLIIRAELAQWVKDWRAIHRAVQEDPVGKHTTGPQRAVTRSLNDAAETARRRKPRAGDGDGFPYGDGPQPVPDRFTSPQEFVRAHEDAGLDIFPRRPQ
jgi:hypothetical protein